MTAWSTHLQTKKKKVSGTKNLSPITVKRWLKGEQKDQLPAEGDDPKETGRISYNGKIANEEHVISGHFLVAPMN